jgi:methylase of polypeptide subunit release factors
MSSKASSTTIQGLTSQANNPNAEVLDRLGLGRWAVFDHKEVARSHRAHIAEEMIAATYNVAGLSIECPAGIYHPSAESSSLFLLRHVPSRPTNPCPNVLELGVGSGAVLFALARMWAGGQYTGIDISPNAIAVAGRNADRNGIAADIRLSDLFEALQNELFDVVLFNPPYYDKQPHSRIEMETMCDPGGRLLGRFLEQLSNHLAPDGVAHLVISNIGCLSPLMDCDFKIKLEGAELFGNGMIRAVIGLERSDGA